MAGVYVLASLDSETVDQLTQYATHAGIPILPGQSLHVTVFACEDCDVGQFGHEVYESPVSGQVLGLELFDYNKNLPTEGKCLVVTFDSPDLAARRAQYMEAYRKRRADDLERPTFTPHVSLTYNADNISVDALPPITNFVEEIKLISEHSTCFVVGGAK